MPNVVGGSAVLAPLLPGPQARLRSKGCMGGKCGFAAFTTHTPLTPEGRRREELTWEKTYTIQIHDL
ncbi:hypothetical protein Krac_2835 [Ktedonobacter racemifer DSM 44963]|uniref:Uncharacterized protein n=1 Tax=Ktedonobacter racemifer DSM 44963 TaxID=485913 RepID=D6TZS0_KTERA|nr:hypothetical protein Krac_2835 [Ktedonobacter racemifer DSM 44963]